MIKQKTFKNIYIASIHQNAGKTTIALGLYRALKDRNIKPAFLKPIGQEVFKVGDQKVDKDSYLMGNVFRCRHFKEMSPVTIGRGFTEQYIFNPQKEKLQESIEKAFKKLIKGKDAIIVEGTGHAGVGSVIDFSNADVAQLLGSKTILVCEGGIGKSIDEIMLNKALFDLKGVDILGVIVNKVLPEKYNKIKKSLSRGLANKGIKLLGVIPVVPLLSAPTVEQVKSRLNLKILCGGINTSRRVKHNIVAAMEPHNMIHYLKEETLVLTSGDRVDNILVAVSADLVGGKKENKVSGIILTGGLMPNPKIVDLLKKSRIPILITDDDTYSVAAKIEHLICKIQRTDKDKIKEAAFLVKKYINVNAILKNF